MAQRNHSDATEEVEIALAIDVPQLGSFATFEHDRWLSEYRNERAPIVAVVRLLCDRTLHELMSHH